MNASVLFYKEYQLTAMTYRNDIKTHKINYSLLLLYHKRVPTELSKHTDLPNKTVPTK